MCLNAYSSSVKHGFSDTICCANCWMEAIPFQINNQLDNTSISYFLDCDDSQGKSGKKRDWCFDSK